MIRLYLQRLLTRGGATLGTLRTHDGAKFYFTLEDGPSPHPYGLKVAGQTRIPAGEYELGLVRGTPMDQDKRDRWPNWHRHGLLWVKNVPGFERIRIHEGNTHKDTAGCPLVGFGATCIAEEAPTVTRSVDAYKDLYLHVAPALARGASGRILVIDEPVGP